MPGVGVTGHVNVVELQELSLTSGSSKPAISLIAEGDQMTVKDLEVLYDYGYWANNKLFQLISQLAPEQFTQPVAGSYGSIKNTLVPLER